MLARTRQHRPQTRNPRRLRDAGAALPLLLTPRGGEPGGVLPGTTGALGSRRPLQMPHCIRLTVPHALRVGRAAKRSAGGGWEASGIPIIPTASSAPPLGSRGRASCGEIVGIKWDG